MNTWIFQSTPNQFNINSFIFNNNYLYWSVPHKKHQRELRIGDVVYIWRAQGHSTEVAGIVGKGYISEECKHKSDVDWPEQLSEYLWSFTGKEASEIKAGIKLQEARLTPSSGMLTRSYIKSDSILKNMAIVRSNTGTNFLLNNYQVETIEKLWSKNNKNKNVFYPHISQGDVLNNSELCKIFSCAPRGGMRRSKTTNTLVLISDKTRGVYKDYWTEDSLHYTGMGLKGPQSLSFSQNKTLAESNSNDINVFLFEVYRKGKYHYKGRVFLVGDPRIEKQEDIKGKNRNVWIFPLKLGKEITVPPIDKEDLDRLEKETTKKIKKLSNKNLFNRLKNKSPQRKQKNKRPSTTTTRTKSYDRDSLVTEYAYRRANGQCQLCNGPAPFKRKIDPFEPFLEAHHIKWLSRKGPDTVENTVALCPNCHRKMHILDLDKDKQHIRSLDLKLKELN